MKTQRPYKLASFKLVVISLSLVFSHQIFADFILTAPPRESLEKGQIYYGPIAKSLSKLIGKKIKYQQPRNWFDYSIKMRSGVYDIVFDGPHFASWRIENTKHLPVATLPGKLQFILFTDVNNKLMNNIVDLSDKVMCGMLAPNLATNIIMSEFQDPGRQPMIYESQGFSSVYRNFMEGECHAAVLRNKAYYKLSKNDKSSIKIIHTTDALPNQTITIGPKLKKYHKKISRYLTSADGARAASKLLKRFSKNNPKFIEAKLNQYNDLEKLLKGSDSSW